MYVNNFNILDIITNSKSNLNNLKYNYEVDGTKFILTSMLLNSTITRMINAAKRINPTVEYGKGFSGANIPSKAVSPVAASRVLNNDHTGVTKAFSTPSLLCVKDD